MESQSALVLAQQLFEGRHEVRLDQAREFLGDEGWEAGGVGSLSSFEGLDCLDGLDAQGPAFD